MSAEPSSAPIDVSALTSLRDLYPAQTTDGHDHTWAVVAICAFSAANLPEAVPQVFAYAAKEETSHDGRLLLARKARDALFKSGMLSGYPKAINALAKLHASLPEDLRDREPMRPSNTTTDELHRTGEDLFMQTYGEKADDVRTLLHDIYPDLGHFSITFAYGYVYGASHALTPTETSFAFVAALIAADVPTQIDWHLRGARHHGATLEQVRAVRKIAIEASRAAGIIWKNAIPELAEN
ncbi:AhpD-like protein [Schizophyllum fasciatum]